MSRIAEALGEGYSYAEITAFLGNDKRVTDAKAEGYSDEDIVNFLRANESAIDMKAKAQKDAPIVGGLLSQAEKKPSLIEGITGAELQDSPRVVPTYTDTLKSTEAAAKAIPAAPITQTNTFADASRQTITAQEIAKQGVKQDNAGKMRALASTAPEQVENSDKPFLRGLGSATGDMIAGSVGAFGQAMDASGFGTPESVSRVYKNLKDRADSIRPEDVSKMSEMDQAAYYLGSGLATSAGSLLAIVQPELALPYLGVMGVTTSGNKYQSLRERGVEKPEAQANALVTGTAEALTEMLGIKGGQRVMQFYSKLPLDARRQLTKRLLLGTGVIAMGAAEEGTEELINKQVENATDILTGAFMQQTERGNQKTAGKLANTRIAEGSGEAFKGGAYGGLLFGAGGAVVADQQTIKPNNPTEVMLDQMDQAVTGSTFVNDGTDIALGRMSPENAQYTTSPTVTNQQMGDELLGMEATAPRATVDDIMAQQDVDAAIAAAQNMVDTPVASLDVADVVASVTQPEEMLDGRTDVGGTNAEMTAQGVESAGSDVPGSGTDTQAGLLGGLAGGGGSTGSMATPAGVDSVAGDAGVPGLTVEQELAGDQHRKTDAQNASDFARAKAIAESASAKIADASARRKASAKNSVEFAQAELDVKRAWVDIGEAAVLGYPFTAGPEFQERVKNLEGFKSSLEHTKGIILKHFPSIDVDATTPTMPLPGESAAPINQAGEPVAPQPTQSLTQEGQTQSPQVTSEGAAPAVVITPAQQKVVDAVNASLVDEQAKLGDKAPPLQVLTVAAPEQMTPAVRESLPLAQAFLQAAGYQHEMVVVAPTDDKTLDFDGAVASNGAGIVIAADSARTVPRVVVHEFGHEMRKEAPQVWETLAAEILGRTDKAAQLAHLKKRGYSGETMTPPMAEEFVNDVLSDMLNSGKEGPRILVDVASNMDKTEPGSGKEFLKRLLEFIDKVIKGMVGKGYGTEATILKGEVGAIRKAIAKALTDYNLQAKKAEKAKAAAEAAKAKDEAAEAKKAALAAEVERAKAKPVDSAPAVTVTTREQAEAEIVKQAKAAWNEQTKGSYQPLKQYPAKIQVNGKTIFMALFKKGRGGTVLYGETLSKLMYGYSFTQYKITGDKLEKTGNRNLFAHTKDAIAGQVSDFNDLFGAYAVDVQFGQPDDLGKAKPAEPTPPVDTATDEVAKADGAGVDVLADLQEKYDAAKAALDAIGPEPRKPSSEKRAFGTKGREGATPGDVLKYDTEVKRHKAWRAKYSKLKKAEVEASNALFREKQKAGPKRSLRNAAVDELNAKLLEQEGIENAFVPSEMGDPGIIDAFKKVFNVEIVPIAGRDDFLGMQFNGRLYVNAEHPNAGFVHIAGHELLHDLARKQPGIYAAFESEARNFSLRDAVPAYARRLGEAGSSPDTDTYQEILADFVGEALTDPVFLQQMADANPTKFRMFVNAVTKWLDKVAEKLKFYNLHASDYFKEVTGLREYLVDVLDAYSDTQTLPEYTGIKRSLRNVITQDTRDALVKGWTQIGGADTAFTYPRSESKSMGEIMLKVAPRLQVDHLGGDVDLADGWMVFAKDSDGKADRTRPGYVMQYKDGKVELNVAEWGEGNDGAALYAAVGNYAYNNGLVFAGDRMGISETGRARRLENMISLALKYKTTRHIEPHVDMLVDFSWEEGNDNYNLGEMLAASYRLTAEIAPEIEDITYDPDTKEFAWVPAADRRAGRLAGDGQDAAAGYDADTYAAGAAVSESDFKKIVEDARDRGGRLGRKTLVRAILSNTFARRAQADERAGERAGDVVVPRDVTDGVLYSKRAPLQHYGVPKTWGNGGMVMTPMDSAIYTLQDKHIELKRAVQEIKATGAQLDDKWDPYLTEELFHGRAASRAQAFIKNELEPLTQDLLGAGITIAEMDDYLWARHAINRNEEIEKINPEQVDANGDRNGSGLTDAEAQAKLDALTPAAKAQLESFAVRVDAINAETRRLMVEYGLETQSLIDEWEQKYPTYVPLMRDVEDEGGMGSGAGFSTGGKTGKRAMGSARPVENVLANIANQRDKVINKGEKNRVALAVYGAALLNPNPDFWGAINPLKINDNTPANIAAIEKARLRQELTAMGLPANTISNMVDRPTEKSIHPITGMVVRSVNPLYSMSDNILSLRVNGEDRFVVFNPTNEKAVRAIAALKNLEVADRTYADPIVENTMHAVGAMTRYFSKINTQYNPVFGAVNFVRDVQGALLNLESTELKGQQKEILGDISRLMKDAAKHGFRMEKLDPADLVLWKEMLQEGGTTGYRDLFKTGRERNEAIVKALDPKHWQTTKWGKILTANGYLSGAEQLLIEKTNGVVQWLSDYNETMENVTRLAVFKAARDHGLSGAKAASLSKNITTNFNRRGSIGQQAGMLYAFFNAAVQGTTRIADTLLDRSTSGKYTVSQAGKAIIGGGLLVGMLQPLLLALAGYGDDEPPEFVRDRNLIIPLWTKDSGVGYATIPMPLGFHVIPALSRIPVEAAMHGNGPGDVMWKLMSVLLEAFNPLGGSGMSLQTIAPTIVDPMVSLATNKDWNGRPIYQESFSNLNQSPGHSRAKDTSTELGYAISYAINRLSGGDEYQAGEWSPTPDAVEYMIGQITGGVGREVMKAWKTGKNLATGEAVAAHQIPLVGRFYGRSDGKSGEGAKFYDNLKYFNELRREKLDRIEAKDNVSQFKMDNPDHVLIEAVMAARTDVNKLRKHKDELKAKGASRERIRLIDDKITGRMARINEKIEKRRERLAD